MFAKVNKRDMNDTCNLLEFQKQMLYIEKKVMAIAVRGVIDIDARYKTWCEGLRSLLLMSSALKRHYRGSFGCR